MTSIEEKMMRKSLNLPETCDDCNEYYCSDCADTVASLTSGTVAVNATGEHKIIRGKLADSIQLMEQNNESQFTINDSVSGPSAQYWDYSRDELVNPPEPVPQYESKTYENLDVTNIRMDMVEGDHGYIKAYTIDTDVHVWTCQRGIVEMHVEQPPEDVDPNAEYDYLVEVYKNIVLTEIAKLYNGWEYFTYSPLVDDDCELGPAIWFLNYIGIPEEYSHIIPDHAHLSVLELNCFKALLDDGFIEYIPFFYDDSLIRNQPKDEYQYKITESGGRRLQHLHSVYLDKVIAKRDAELLVPAPVEDEVCE